jgi:two-component system response regulator DegU
MSIQPRRRRVVIVDDHTLFREGLRSILGMEDDFEVIADVESAEDLVELMWETKPDVLLLDIRMPQGSGLDALPAVVRISPNTSVLVLTACDEMEEHVRAFKLGARGVVLKDSARQTLVQAIRSVCRGETWMDPRMRGVLVAELARSGSDSDELMINRDDGLTDRELEIVRLVAAGKKNKEVAEILAISERTVRTNLTSVFQKVGVRDRIGLVMYALRHGLTAAA